MPLTDSQVYERFHNVDVAHLKMAGRVEVLESEHKTLDEEKRLLWLAVDSVRAGLSGIQIKVAGIVGAISIFQVIITAWIVYKITKG